MKRFLILCLFLFCFLSANMSERDKADFNVVKELILIKNTYDWCNDYKVRFDMILRQNKWVNDLNRHLYLDYLIKE